MNENGIIAILVFAAVFIFATISGSVLYLNHLDSKERIECIKKEGSWIEKRCWFVKFKETK